MINRLFDRGPLEGVSVPSWSDALATHWAFKDIEEASQEHFFVRSSSGTETILE